MNSQFIVLEGPDGSGTTTHAALLAEALQGQGKDILLTNEPTDGPIGVFIRTHLRSGMLPAYALQLLFTADRAWHVREVIEPALKTGKTVICDRYWLSTVIYAEALGVNPNPLLELNMKFIQPTTEIILLPSFEVAFGRVSKRKEREILEEDSLQKKVYDGYEKYAKQMNIPVVDSGKSMEATASDILNLIPRS